MWSWRIPGTVLGLVHAVSWLRRNNSIIIQQHDCGENTRFSRVILLWPDSDLIPVFFVGFTVFFGVLRYFYGSQRCNVHNVSLRRLYMVFWTIRVCQISKMPNLELPRWQFGLPKTENSLPIVKKRCDIHKSNWVFCRTYSLLRVLTYILKADLAHFWPWCFERADRPILDFSAFPPMPPRELLPPPRHHPTVTCLLSHYQ